MSQCTLIDMDNDVNQKYLLICKISDVREHINCIDLQIFDYEIYYIVKKSELKV